MCVRNFQVLSKPVAFPPTPRSTSLQMSPATVANIGGIHLEAYANSSGLSRRDLEKRSLATKINKLKCGINGGGLANYDEGRKRFYQFAGGPLSEVMGSIALSTVKYKLQDALCGNQAGETCDMIIGATLATPGWLFADQVGELFDKAFDDIRQECKDNGGSVELIADPPAGGDICGIPTCTADGKMGLKVADLEAQFYEHDGGATCPANPPKADVCEVSSFN
jgi:hypothetical protein